VFPGEFLTRDNVPSGASRRTAQSGGGEGILVTAGFTQIKLTDSTGEEITSFANGAEVGVVMRVPEGGFNPDTGAPVVEGDNVPIFTYDEAAAEWKVEYNSNGTIKRGTVMRDSDGMYVPFTTNHLSWFNLDWKGIRCPTGHPAIKAVDATGKYLTSFTVIPTSEESSYWQYPRNTNDGIVEFMNAPADIQWSVSVSAEGFTSDPVNIIECRDVTVSLRQLNAISPTRVEALCGGRPYADVNIYAYREGVRIGSQMTLSDGAANLTLPADAGLMIYGTSTDSCKDVKGEFLTTSASNVPSFLTLNFKNACCAGYVEPLRISGLTPAKATGVNPEAAVSGTIVFSKAVPASSVPALTITLKQGETTIIAGAAASTLGAVSWSDASGGTARTLSFTAARAADIQAGKTYSFTVGLTPSAVVATDSAALELSSYLSTTSGVVSYTSASVTGSFSTVSDGTNRLPDPVPGANKDAGIGTLVSLDGSASSDPDGDPLTFKWEQVSGPSVVISNSTSAVATFTPSVAGIYVFKLTVNDGRRGIVSAQTTITVCEIFCGTNAHCDDSDPLTYDVCENPNTCAAECSNTQCSAVCSSNADCDDSDPVTVDECANPGTCGASCVNCVPECENNSQCDDSDPLTIDACENTNTCAAECVNTPCEAACYSASDCDDGDPDTNDMCVAPASCEAECVFVIPNSNMNIISAGHYHSCAIHTDGTVKCWGHNGHGQLGNGSTISSSAPVTVTDISDAISVAAGYYHTCATLSNGQIKCWGMNQYGQLGDGTKTGSSVPITVTGISDVVSVAAGSSFTCATLSDGQVKCWGYNSYGQLGNGSTTDSSVPVTVTGISNAVSVAAGNSHTCVSLSDGQVKCWGGNVYGQLGNGSKTDSLAPVNVAGISNAVSVAASIYHTCAVLSDGQVKCWGSNSSGQFGDGTTTDSLAPVNVTGISNAVSVAVGSNSTCASLSDGNVKCWGGNFYGQLGSGSTSNSSVPVAVTGISDATSVAASIYHTCASLSDGQFKCWGNNAYGQLGDGTTTDSLVPVLVTPF
jgi:alpha-tubulin suppressor-like RCC1 family protein